ncbi:hypothetical protein ATCC90586_005364 [Pythium insidiosum]|nr:hypothetical protein ATCC90586_005364 [Pythium insidiosum]
MRITSAAVLTHALVLATAAVDAGPCGFGALCGRPACDSALMEQYKLALPQIKACEASINWPAFWSSSTADEFISQCFNAPCGSSLTDIARFADIEANKCELHFPTRETSILSGEFPSNCLHSSLPEVKAEAAKRLGAGVSPTATPGPTPTPRAATPPPSAVPSITLTVAPTPPVAVVTTDPASVRPSDMQQQSTDNRYPPAPGATLGRSRSEQLLLRKRTDWEYLDPPASRRAGQPLSPRQRKTAAAHQQQPQSEPHDDESVVQDDVDTIGPPRLSRKEKAYLIRRAKESAQALIEHAHTLDGPVQWHYKGRHRGIQMYRGQGIQMDHGSATANANASALEFLCGVTTMMGTLEEVSEYFDQCTTPRMRMRKADDVVDCAVLYSLVSSNTVNPFHRVAIKYTQYDSPVAMTRKRDFCYLECQDTFRHAGTGRRGWVLSMHSIKLPTCPDVPGFVRASMYHSGFVFIESAERPGYMDVMHSLQINFKGNNHLPHFMLNAALKRRLRELIRISREIQVARIAHRTLLQEKDLMPKNLRSSLYEEISHLSRLQREKASTTDSEKQEEIKERIREQYQLLRTLKLQGGQ